MNKNPIYGLPRSPRAEGGFTLVELLIAVAIMTITLAIAVPNFNTARSLVINQSREFKSALNFARNEAVNRSRDIIMCPSDDATVAVPECDASWHSGWVIYVDEDNDGEADAGEVLRRHDVLKGGVTITGNPVVASITFDNQGFTGAASNFLFCSDADKNQGRTVLLALSGRAMRSKTVTVCP